MPSLLIASTLLLLPSAPTVELPFDARRDGDPMLESSKLGGGLTGPTEPDLACPTGSYPCGAEYCTPNGGVCCASVGHPEGYCPGGSACCSDGTCSSTGSCPGDGGTGGEGGGESSCYPDVSCDEGCCPAGSVCGSAGSAKCCPESAPYHCPDEGLCHAEPDQCETDSESDTGSSSPGSDPEGWTCSTAHEFGGSCSYVRFCLDEADPCRGYYEADGQQFSCSDACDASSIHACAQATADYCINAVAGGSEADEGNDSGAADDAGGCTVASRDSAPGAWLVFGLLLGLGLVRGRSPAGPRD